MQYSFIQQVFSEHLLYAAFWSCGQGRNWESLPSREVLRETDLGAWLRGVDEDGGLGGRGRACAAPARLSGRPSQP